MSAVDFLWRNLPNFLLGFPGQRPGGLLLSLWLAGIAIVLGFIMAVWVGSLGASRWWILRRIAAAYVAIFRGLPLLLLLLVIHQVVGGNRTGLDFSPMTSSLVALTLYTSAYQAEVIRAGLMAVPIELVETARSMGSGSWRIFFRIRLRYALRLMLPALINEMITLFKDSSVLLILGVGELMTVARASLGSSVRNSVYWLPTYLFVGVLYALVALGISRLAAHWERKRQPAGLIRHLGLQL